MKEIAFIKGDRINLVVLQKSIHFNFLIKWINDPEVNMYLHAGNFPITPKMQEKWLDEKANDNENIVLGITTKKGKFIGTIGLHHIDYFNRIAELGILIGDKSEWGNGYATEAEKMLIEYAFNTLHLNKITRGVLDRNKSSHKVAIKNGFSKEGLFKQHLLKNGRFENVAKYALLRKDWKQQKP